MEIHSQDVRGLFWPVQVLKASLVLLTRLCRRAAKACASLALMGALAWLALPTSALASAGCDSLNGTQLVFSFGGSSKGTSVHYLIAGDSVTWSANPPANILPANTGVIDQSSFALLTSQPYVVTSDRNDHYFNGNAQSQNGAVTVTYSCVSAAATAAPTLTNVSPVGGPSAGGTVVKLTGSNFGAGTTVTFDGQQATNVSIDTSTSITATTPPYSGNLAVNIVVNNGRGSATLSGFRYVDGPPQLSSISPNVGGMAGGTPVVLTGSNFVPGMTATVGGVAMTSVTFVDTTSLTAVTPAYVSGSTTEDVTVTNPTLDSSTLSGGFTYLSSAPSVTAV
jgi:hypothetical protein